MHRIIETVMFTHGAILVPLLLYGKVRQAQNTKNTDLDILRRLLAYSATVGPTEEDLSEYADLIHALPEIYAHGRIDRKSFWKCFVKPYITLRPGHLGDDDIAAIKAWSGAWF